MGVLRQNLTEREEERSQLDRKVTELSATVSSTLASYAFLEEALTAETTKYDCHSTCWFCLPTYPPYSKNSTKHGVCVL